jgi:hypothetical protein
MALTDNPYITDAQLTAAFSATVEDSRKGESMKKPNLFERLAAMFSGVSDEALEAAVIPEKEGKPADPPATDPPAVPAEDPKPDERDAEIATLKAQLEAKNDQVVTDHATTFSQKAITDGKATPAEEASLKAMFAQAMKDDNSGKATFSEGDRVAKLREMIEARPVLNLTQEVLKGETASFSVVAGAKSPADDDLNPTTVYAKRKVVKGNHAK